MIENVLSEFDTTLQQEQSKSDSKTEIVESVWTNTGYINDFDRGSLFAGSDESDKSFNDFLIKFTSLLISTAKDGKPSNKNQKIFALLKSIIDLYYESLQMKPDDVKSNLKYIASIHGFVDSYVKSIKNKGII